jgi:sec-independent protein translocase protein TatC
MPLVDHLRELRNRLAKAVLAIIVVAVLAAYFYTDIIEWFTAPVLKSVGCQHSLGELMQQNAQHTGGTPPKTCAHITLNGLLSPFTLALKVSLTAGVVLSSPIWLYQLWAFVAPGLHRNEKKYALGFVAAGFPLFLGGAFFAYKVLPTTAKVLIAFTPFGVNNLLPLDDLIGLVTRMVVVFGLSFEMPLLLVMLNFGGVISGARMRGWWRGMILGITLFAAIATPSTDPISMLGLAAPIWVLYFAATAIALLNDRRRAARLAAGPADDEASELDLTPEDIGEVEAVPAPRALPEGEGAARGGYDDVT